MQGLPSHPREQVVCDKVDARGTLRCAGGQAMARGSGLRQASSSFDSAG